MAYTAKTLASSIRVQGGNMGINPFIFSNQGLLNSGALEDTPYPYYLMFKQRVLKGVSDPTETRLVGAMQMLGDDDTNTIIYATVDASGEISDAVEKTDQTLSQIRADIIALGIQSAFWKCTSTNYADLYSILFP